MGKSANLHIRGYLKPAAIFITILLAGWFVYFNSLVNPFIWDDLALVSNNLHIRNLAYIPRLFIESVYHQDMDGRFYRPILMMSYALDYRLYGLSPLGYHLSNILIHSGVALLVYGLISLIFRRNLLAFLTAMFFVLHPIQTEAVTYISGRADPLAAFFCLLSLYFFVRYVDFEGIKRKLYFGASALSFMLGLLTKESSAAFPLILVFYEACFRKDGLKKKKIAKYAVYLIILLAYGIMRHFILLNVKASYSTANFMPTVNRLYTVPLVIFTYLKLLLFPKDLHMDRSDFLFDWPLSFFEPRVIFTLSTLIIITALVWVIRKRSKEVLFGAGWFMLLLLPFLNIVPINAFVAEHWLYLASIGFFLMLSWVFIGLLRFRFMRLCIAGLIIVIFAVFGALTIKQNYIWRDPIILYSYISKLSPASVRALSNLSAAYYDSGLYEKAEKKARQALAAEPSGIFAINNYINLGLSLYKEGRKEEALEAYTKAIEINPDYSLGYWYMGDIFYSGEETDRAIGFYKKAALLTPSNASYWYTLGNAYMKNKRFKEASDAYEKALEAYPYFFEVRINLAASYSSVGLLKKAFAEYQEALKINPGSPEAYYGIGNICAAIGETEKAREFWQEALKKNPAHAGAKEKLEKIKGQVIDK